jgi:ribosomal protein L3 glutamine methyltransferase
MFFNRLRTIGDIARNAAKRFDKAGLAYGQGAITSGDDAVFIVLETLGLPVDSFEENWKNPVSAADRVRIMAVVEERIRTRKPASYLLNKAYLHGYEFYVDERTIIPRSYIAEILCHEDGFGPVARMGKVESVLDLCTGSGCLAIIAAHLFPDAMVDAVDLSADALEVAKRNVADHKLQNRVSLYQGSLFAPLAGKKYDLIITNPPYVDAEGMADLPQEYRHEPEMALGLCGEDGMDLVRQIMKDAPDHLNPDGAMICELGRGGPVIQAAYPGVPFLWLDTIESSGEVFWLARKDWPK